MIETKLLVDRYIQFTRPAIVHQTVCNMAGAKTRDPRFEPVVCPPQSIQQSTRRDPLPGLYGPARNWGGQRTSLVAGNPVAAPPPGPRSFKFLPWYEGDIAETTLDLDVLTGPMSGCVLVRYRSNGVVRAGHIGTVTVTPQSPQWINDDVKGLWNGFANANPADVLGGFNPAAANHVHQANPGDVGGEIWGLITTGGQFFSIMVCKQHPPAGNEWRIASLMLVPTMTLQQLQNL
jgi:hypothetical protein